MSVDQNNTNFNYMMLHMQAMQIPTDRLSVSLNQQIRLFTCTVLCIWPVVIFTKLGPCI